MASSSRSEHPLQASMTCADQPSVVEQNRLLSGMIKCVQSEDRSSGRSVCNEHSCPTMSAGP